MNKTIEINGTLYVLNFLEKDTDEEEKVFGRDRLGRRCKQCLTTIQHPTHS